MPEPIEFQDSRPSHDINIYKGSIQLFRPSTFNKYLHVLLM